MTTVLFATDGSEAAGVAERLVGSIPWPAGTLVRIVTVVPWVADLVGSPWAAATPLHTDEIEAAQVRTAEQQVRESAERLRARGVTTAWVVMRGRPADGIVDAAVRDGADLIVLGSRGLGAVEGALLGSVSEAVSDRAPCPVLIARGEAIHRSMLADDNEEGAAVALDYLCNRPHLLGTSTRCVTVENPTPIWPETFDMPIVDARSVQMLADDERQAASETRTAVSSHANRLREAGQPALAEAVEGQPGPALVASALDSDADLVVVGSRHRTGLTRLVLGSVGRFVMHHAHCSVLLVGRLPEHATPEPTATAAPTPVGVAGS